MKVHEFEFTQQELNDLKSIEAQVKDLQDRERYYLVNVVAKRLGVNGIYKFNFDLKNNKIQLIEAQDMFRGPLSPPKMSTKFPHSTR